MNKIIQQCLGGFSVAVIGLLLAAMAGNLWDFRKGWDCQEPMAIFVALLALVCVFVGLLIVHVMTRKEGENNLRQANQVFAQRVAFAKGTPAEWPPIYNGPIEVLLEATSMKAVEYAYLVAYIHPEVGLISRWVGGLEAELPPGKYMLVGGIPIPYAPVAGFEKEVAASPPAKP